MEVVVARCAGLDVHKKTVMACVRTPGEGGQREQVVREFTTFTAELRKLRQWLGAQGVTQVVMEATGVYWKPVWQVLEEAPGWELKLVNAQ
ncbi:MAG: IS110 family transposase, partial [Pseudonocardiaceae bacterium]